MFLDGASMLRSVHRWNRAGASRTRTREINGQCSKFEHFNTQSFIVIGNLSSPPYTPLGCQLRPETTSQRRSTEFQVNRVYLAMSFFNKFSKNSKVSPSSSAMEQSNFQTYPCNIHANGFQLQDEGSDDRDLCEVCLLFALVCS